MSEKTTIAVDALGGDNAPGAVLEGVEQALGADEALDVILCGPEDVVVPFCEGRERARARVCTQSISMGEHPALAVRRKKDSSIVVGCRLVKDGEARGFFSAGSTGACLAAGTLVIGRVKGIARPCLATVVPSPVRPTVLADVGANADCKPEYLVQFAAMARIYAERVLGVENPSVALLNIGEEETKGSKFAQEAHALMKEQVAGFAGNAEGRDVLAGTFDVIVCDGFTGNVCLKTVEGTAKVLFHEIGAIMKASPLTKLGAATMVGGMKDLVRRIDPDRFGGAPLLGVKGACIVGHGSSGAAAIKNGVLTAASIAREDVAGLIADELAGAEPQPSQAS